MHELLLYGQVPAARHEQLLSILAGLAAMQPRRIVERRAIYRPTKSPSANVIQRGGTQNIQTQKQAQNQRANDLHFVHLVKPVDERDFGKTIDLTASSEEAALEGSADPKRPWTFELQETPEPGKRSVGLRYAHLNEIIEGDPNRFLVNFGYRHVKEYVLEGHRFVLDNTIVLLYRILLYPDSQTGTNIRTTLPPFKSLKLLDPSGAYIMEVKLRVADGSNASLVSTGQQELERFQNTMQGVVELKVPDRLALDTRVR